MNLFVSISIIALLVSADNQQALPPAPPPVPRVDLDCRLRHEATETSSLRDLPVGMRTFLATKLEPLVRGQEGIADRGEYFNASGSGDLPGPSKRFTRGGQFRGVWFVFFESMERDTRGAGHVYREVAVFSHVTDTPSILVRGWAISDNQSLCAIVDHMLDEERVRVALK